MAASILPTQAGNTPDGIVLIPRIYELRILGENLPCSQTAKPLVANRGYKEADQLNPEPRKENQ